MQSEAIHKHYVANQRRLMYSASPHVAASIMFFLLLLFWLKHTCAAATDCMHHNALKTLLCMRLSMKLAVQTSDGQTMPVSVWTSTLRRTIQTAEHLPFPKLRWKVGVLHCVVGQARRTLHHMAPCIPSLAKAVSVPNLPVTQRSPP